VTWLDALYPTPPLFAPDPKTAEAQRNLADWSDSSFAFYWNRWRTSRYPQPGDESPIDDSLLARIRDHVGRRLGRTPTTRADAREFEIIEELIDRMTDLVGFLRDRPYFHGDTPSIADIAVYAMLRILRDGAIPYCADAIAERPTRAAFLDRMEGLIKPLETGEPQLGT